MPIKPKRTGPAWRTHISTPIKSAVGALAALAVIVGFFIAIDDRYAHAGDMRQLSTDMQINRLASENSILDSRRKAVEDKMYELAAKNQMKRLAPSEQSILQRYSSELRDVQREISEKRQLIERLKTGK